jgi:hypothetical protein
MSNQHLIDENKIAIKNTFSQFETTDIWIELARRFNVRFGKIQMAIHEGKPSKYANVDMRIDTDEKFDT